MKNIWRGEIGERKYYCIDCDAYWDDVKAYDLHMAAHGPNYPSRHAFEVAAIDKDRGIIYFKDAESK